MSVSNVTMAQRLAEAHKKEAEKPAPSNEPTPTAEAWDGKAERRKTERRKPATPAAAPVKVEEPKPQPTPEKKPSPERTGLARFLLGR